ncbi:MAG: ribosome maturation factor RimP [Firmicutes bacterium]|nr:ribosome maturation factor RimP [Bacillota bacterium]
MAKIKDIEATVRTLITPVTDERGYELVDLEFVKEGPQRYLRVYIDKPGGVAIDDCEFVSRALERMLDEKDFIEEAYILEISSPGLDRPLKKESDFVRYAGEQVDIKLYSPKEGKKEFSGMLIGLQNDIISIRDEAGKVLEFEKKAVASVRLAVIF